jgi:hypothetical protein
MICCSFLPHVSNEINIILKFLFITEKFLHKILQPPKTYTWETCNMQQGDIAKRAAVTGYVGITTARAQHNCLTKLMCAFSHIKKMSDPRAVLGFFTDRVNILMHSSTVDAPRKY